jgi:hypothetical protein
MSDIGIDFSITLILTMVVLVVGTELIDRYKQYKRVK